MGKKRQISVRINEDLINDFVESLQQYREELDIVSEVSYSELKMTNILELALTHGMHQLKQEKEKIQWVNAELKKIKEQKDEISS